jgi:hypothetical protein
MNFQPPPPPESDSASDSEPDFRPNPASDPASTLPAYDPSPEPEGYLWRPMQPPAPLPVEAPVPPPRPPRLIPNLGDVAVFYLLLIPSFIAGFLACFLILLFVLHPTQPRKLPQLMTHNIVEAMSMQAAWYGVQWALAALVFGVWWGRSLAQGVHWKAAVAKRRFLRLAFLGVATGLVITLTGNFLPMPKAPPILEDLTNSQIGAWLLMIFGITLAPLTEELAFRGFLLPGLVNFFRWLQRHDVISETAVAAIGIPIAIVLTSIPFALLHAQQVSDSWGPLLLIGLVSVILCIVRLAMDSVAAGVVVHACYNLTLFMGLLVQTDGFRHLQKLKM